jgi:GntR family transcriptional repressor for pyruvate dehydrogenase complex
LAIPEGVDMPFRPVQPEKISSAVVHQIEQLILRGILRPSERLPSERELADRMGVSRPSLRDAIGSLQNSGLLTTRAGAGIFVADVLGSAFSPALTKLFRRHKDAVFDYLSFRRDIEGLAAERASKMASDTDLTLINTIFKKMDSVHPNRSPDEDAKLDAQFHMAIIEASHNVIMLHMMRSMFELLREGVFYNRQIMFKQRITRKALLDQHRVINHALQDRNPNAARTAIHDHLDYIEYSFRNQMNADQNEEIALQRLDQETNRLDQ